MGDLLCENNETRAVISDRAERLGGEPCRCKSFNKDGECEKWAKGFRWSRGNVYCEDVFYREDEVELNSVPTIQASIDHRNSKVIGEEFAAAACWVEWATKRQFRVCYE